MTCKAAVLPFVIFHRGGVSFFVIDVMVTVVFEVSQNSGRGRLIATQLFQNPLYLEGVPVSRLQFAAAASQFNTLVSDLLA
ncbi:MAG TPA: hypothetical protein VKP66_03420 [Steroidobacteraceae bacterium]|nr:hypothetical protein [Steroidobacteraceae bacterium]